MFSTLGLLAAGQCPERDRCTRVRCFFSHNDQPPAANRKAVTAKAAPTPVSSHKRPAETVSGAVGQGPAKKQTIEASASKSTKLISRTKPPVPSQPIPATRPTPTPSKSSGPVPGPSTLVPIISKSSKTSPHPLADRQKGLRTLHTQFEKLYGNIPGVPSDLAKQSAIEQESEISTTSSNVTSYKRAIHHAAVSVSRRAKPDSVKHPSVGTMKESRVATEKAEKAANSRLSKDRIEQYLLPLEDFEKWRYPDPNDLELVDPEEIQPDGEGTEQVCSRCKTEFVVSSARLQERNGECHFHHGRLAPERIEGKRVWIYSCCKRARGEAGCEEGVHVFNHGDDDKMLAKRVSYVRVGGTSPDSHVGVEVLGMDCEMIYTTAGSSLARVTIVDESGTAVLDEVVRQHVPVLDVNARFSGISQDQLDKAVMDIKAVRAAALMFIGRDTILVGHGLENDLRALRILHDRIIDTAVLFPHDKGHPFRRALRDIVKEKLGKFIQDRTADLGHSSAEDALAALDLLKWRVRDDKDD